MHMLQSLGLCKYSLRPRVGSSSGICYPFFGPFTVWKPRIRGEFQVKVVLHDYTTPNDDDPKTMYVDVKAFEVGVILQLVDNTGSSHGTVQKTMWEYETYDASTHEIEFPNLDCWAGKMKWGTTYVNGQPHVTEAAVQVNYRYFAAPNGADLGAGSIMASLATSSSADLQTDVEDADIWDGTVTISLNAGLKASGYGFEFGVQTNLAEISFDDCAEGVACCAWGYSSNNALGVTHDPDDHKVVDQSEIYYDPLATSAYCTWLDDAPDAWFAHHYKPAPPQAESYTASATIGKGHNGEVDAEWSGFAYAELGGDSPGAACTAQLLDWNADARINDVWFVE